MVSNQTTFNSSLKKSQIPTGSVKGYSFFLILESGRYDWYHTTCLPLFWRGGRGRVSGKGQTFLAGESPCTGPTPNAHMFRLKTVLIYFWELTVSEPHTQNYTCSGGLPVSFSRPRTIAGWNCGTRCCLYLNSMSFLPTKNLLSFVSLQIPLFT